MIQDDLVIPSITRILEIVQEIGFWDSWPPHVNLSIS